MARHLGIRVVPTAFVNGLYVRGADRLVCLSLLPERGKSAE